MIYLKIKYDKMRDNHEAISVLYKVKSTKIKIIIENLHLILRNT